jgi:delta-aminolevulinic acid dehydratase/porphobilinogen synthase
MPYVQRPDFRSHAHCGCTVEEASESDPYTDLEAEWVDAYEQAARQAREAGEPVVAPSGRRRRDTVLWRMRRNRPDLFNDGVHAH